LRERIERILQEQRNLNRLKEYNLRPRQRLLFTCPPGCGKTMHLNLNYRFSLCGWMG
jgi:SpoVK/Ycf46/Vps4 family AAA+-type ATPase